MKQKPVYLISVLICLFLCLEADNATAAAKDALSLCAKTVIPNLFPFFVLSSFFVQIGLTSAAGSFLAPITKMLFGISGCGASVFVIGILCGYPTGAKTVAELYQSNMLSKKEAEHLLPFCNNAGPLFCIGAVGSMLGSMDVGRFLYFTHLLSALLTGIFLSAGCRKESELPSAKMHTVHIGAAISDSIQSSVTAILTVCGYVVFFSVLRSFFGSLIPPYLLAPLEITAGSAALSVSPFSHPAKLTLLSALIAFGGICVLMQVWGLIAPVGLSLKSYIYGKLLQALLAAGITAMFFLPSPALFRLLFLVILCTAVFCLAKLTKSATKSIIRKERR